MSAEWTTNIQYTAPPAADGVSVTPNAVAWVNSAWVEIEDVTDAAWVLTSICIPTVGIEDAHFEVEIGVGAVGLETVITTLFGIFADLTSVARHPPLTLSIPCDAIPAGARVSIRMRKTGVSVTPWKFAITYLKKPIVGSLTTTTKPTIPVPLSTSFLSLPTNTTAWANGAWATLIVSASADIVITHASIHRAFNGQNFEIDIGKGAAASEVVLTTLRGKCDLGDGPHCLRLPNPLDGILSGERVAVRWRKAGTDPTTGNFGAAYLVKPL